jgi:hypothetical protein
MMKRTVLMILPAVTLVLACSLSMAGGPQIQVQVAEPFEVNGVLHPAGTLSVKAIRDYNPSSTLNEVWVDGRCLGMVVTRKENGDLSHAARNTVVFSRDPEGHLVLVGYDLQGAGSQYVFQYGKLAGKRKAPTIDRSDAVLVAAIVR